MPQGRQTLFHLLNREVKFEKPELQHGFAGESKRGEDFVFVKTDCRRPGHENDTFGAFAIFDGHNGAAAAMYTKENLLNHVLSAVPSGLSRDEWLSVLPRALVSGFVKADKEFQGSGQCSGTTATFVVVDGLTITAASVGDSRCILDTEGVVTTLTVDHRLEVNDEERNRVEASGGTVGKLNTNSGHKVGPMRCWPGGLCLSRSIGDMDVGEFIVPIPYVRQIKIPPSGGRLIIASDGVWDSLESEEAALCARGLPAETASREIVKEALRKKGLRDDTTCLVVDILPLPGTPASTADAKKPKKFCKVLRLFRKSSTKPNRVEELFEEGSAVLSERLQPVHRDERYLNCAVCQEKGDEVDGAGNTLNLCNSCKLKKDAMEGKRPRVLPYPNGMD